MTTENGKLPGGDVPTGLSEEQPREESADPASGFREIFQACPEGLFRLETTAESTPDAPEFLVREVNPAGAALFGREPEQLTGRRFAEWMDDGEADRWAGLLTEVWRTRKSMEERIQIPGQRGVHASRRVAARVTPLQSGVLVSLRDDTEQARAEDQAARSLARLADTQAVARIGSWECYGEEGMWWSEETYRILGADPEDTNPNRDAFLTMVHQGDQEAVLGYFAGIQQSETPSQVDFRLTGYDGKERFLRLRSQSIDQAVGRIRFSCTLQDLTEFREREVRNRTNEELLQQVVNHAPLILYALDEQGTITLSRGKGLIAQGLQPGELEGRNFAEVYGDNEEMMAAVRRALSGEVVDAVMRTGNSYYQRWMTPMRDAEGRPAGVIGVSLDVTDWKAAQSQLKDSVNLLKHSEQQFRHLIEGSIQGILILAPEGHVLFANAAFAEMADSPSPESLVGNEVKPMLVEDVYEELRTEFNALLDGTLNTAKGVAEIRGERRERAVVEYMARCVEWEGQPAVQYTIVDVTERVRAAEELKANQLLLRTVVDTVPQAIMVKDTEGRYVMANRTFAEFHQLHPDQVLGCTASELPGLSAEVADRQQALDARVVESGGTVEIPSLSFIRPDGELTWQRIQKIPLFDPGSHLQGILTVADDITEQKRIEEELTRSQTLLQGIFDSFPARIVVSDHLGQPIFINKNQAEAIGLPAEVAIQRGITCPENDGLDHQKSRGEILAVIERGEYFDYERVRDNSEGREHFERVLRVPLRGAGSNVIGALSTVIDISEQKRMEQALRQAQKMEAIGQLAGGVAHDFNNLLQIMLGYAEVALTSAEDHPEFTHSANQIISTVDRARTLTRQLLMFSRRKEIRPEQADLNELVENMARLLKRVIGEHIAIHMKPASVPLIGMVDKGMMEQVVMNLCVNARDAMPQGGSMELLLDSVRIDLEELSGLELERAGEYIRLTVTDNGTGMGEGCLERIFDPFFTTKEEGQGTGLGLSIVYGIVKQHQGSIQVESRLGEGTTFRMYLPRAKGSHKAARIDDPEAIPGGQERILLIEDEVEVLKTLTDLLETQGYRVICARDGEEGVRVFQSAMHEIDLVISDVVMPKASGRKVVEQVRRLAPDMKIILSTGYNADEMDASFIESHRLRVLEKPYSPRELFQCVRDVLDACPV